MPMYHTDEARAAEPHALPDLEVFYVGKEDFASATEGTCWSIILGDALPEAMAGWYYWYCFPGCLPDSEPDGPYATEEEAVAAAREAAGF